MLHVVAGSKADLARVARVVSGRGTALVLSGGGGRGFAHIGVSRALSELGISLDIIGGTSIGGVFATVIADLMPVDEIIDWASRYFPKVMDYTIPLVSLIKAGRIARSAETTFGDRSIEDLWRSYFCVSSDLTASRPYVHRRGPLVRAIRATSAIPGVMPPVPEGDHLLVDGGVLNNLPIDIAREIAPTGDIIAVDVAPPRGPGSHGDYGLSVSGWTVLGSRLKRRIRHYPGISAVLMRSMIISSMRERDSQVASGLADCYLDLDMRGVSILDFSNPAAVAARGYEAAMPILESWLSRKSAN
jgi:predicted acylesterase/phospholipase RssA